MPVRRAMLAALGLLIALGASPSARAEPCAAWPGEPQPLPRIDDPDPLRSHWAELRARELAERAPQLEVVPGVDAHRLWRHLLCLDPQDADAFAGVLRTRPVRVHRPLVVAAAQAIVPERDGPREPWRELASPLAVGPPRPAPTFRVVSPDSSADPLEGLAALDIPALPEVAIDVAAAPPRVSLADFDRLLGEAEAQLRGARFEEALDAAERARVQLQPVGTGAQGARRARLELVTATAQIALGDDTSARTALARALEADPGLRLDVSTTSPKVLRALDAARVGEESAP